MVELQLPKLAVRVRFPLPAPRKATGTRALLLFFVQFGRTRRPSEAKCGRVRNIASSSPVETSKDEANSRYFHLVDIRFLQKVNVQRQIINVQLYILSLDKPISHKYLSINQKKISDIY